MSHLIYFQAGSPGVWLRFKVGVRDVCGLLLLHKKTHTHKYNPHNTHLSFAASPLLFLLFPSPRFKVTDVSHHRGGGSITEPLLGVICFSQNSSQSGRCSTLLLRGETAGQVRTAGETHRGHNEAEADGSSVCPPVSCFVHLQDIRLQTSTCGPDHTLITSSCPICRLEEVLLVTHDLHQ